MSNSNQFIPLSNQLGIPGSSYRVQLGKMNDKWAARLAKGNDVLDSKVFDDVQSDEPPNANAVVGWVLQVLPIPNINPYQIAKSVGFIRQEAIRNNERAKQKPQISLEEAKKAKLEEIPEEAKQKLEAKKVVGWVKEEEPKPEPAKEEASAGTAPKKKRQLAAIPTGGGTPATAVSSSSSASSASDGIKCKSCGTQIKFCPYCGKPLDNH